MADAWLALGDRITAAGNERPDSVFPDPPTVIAGIVQSLLNPWFAGEAEFRPTLEHLNEVLRNAFAIGTEAERATADRLFTQPSRVVMAREALAAGTVAEVEMIACTRLERAGLLDHPDIGAWLVDIVSRVRGR